MRKILITSAAVFLAAPTFAMIIWYGVSFYPYLDEIGAFSKRGSESIRALRGNFQRIVEIAETKPRVRSYAMEQAFWKLEPEKNRSQPSLHVNNVLWFVSSYIHFSDEEILGIWVDCSLLGCGKGLNVAVEKYYNTKLHNLDERDLIGLAVLVRSPTRYEPGSERSEKRISEIIKLLSAC